MFRFTLTAVLTLATSAAGAPTSNRGLATLASAALPGTGQLMLGSRARGEAQLWLDGACWALWAGFSWYGSAHEQDARLFAAHEAGANTAAGDKSYFRALERYDNADEHNEDIRREARDRYPDDPDAQRRYYETRGYFGEMKWQWSSDSARFDYWETRKSARAATLNAGFALGALLLNRLVGIVDCAFFVREPGARRVDIVPGRSLASVEIRCRF